MNTAGALRTEVHSVRFRLLATLLVFMAVGLFVAGAATHAAQLNSLNDRVNAELQVPRKNLDALAKRGQPNSGAPYASLNSLFTTYLRSGAPGGYVSVMTVVRGRSVILPAGEQPTKLRTAAITDNMWDWSVPRQTVMRDIDLDGRQVRLAITSVSLPGGRPDQGLLITSSEIGAQREEVFASMWTFALASAVTLAMTGLVGYLVTGRLLRPVRRLREATEATTFEDLSKRVEVPASTDDIAQLAMNFNRMLERLESGSDNQRRFVHDASHELRTPMTIIRGYLELLRSGDPNDVDQTRELLLDELDRMQVLVDDLLLLARSGRPDFVTPAWVEADDLLEDVLNRVRVLGERQWRLEARPGGLIRADRRRLTQALEQLAANAVNHTSESDQISVGGAWVEDDGGAPQGGRAVVVRELAARHRASRELEIWVSDTGTGIPADEHERIFERFGKGSNSAATEGSGLGLSIVKAIAEAHGGTVLLESEEGKGSRFTLRIPSGGTDESDETDGSVAADTGGDTEGFDAQGDARPKKRRRGGKPKLAGPASGIELAIRAGGTP
ncbi:sensor histidine kinase [Arthrobacter globiformis]|uniref:histidine kinase n=1 Tax=Arthrobacter globiformis TaxID=1665 RepID=A0A328HBD4_ARTGO|nr:HAMP domain-containing sensor histidine kinase [Arthrobacter globiformis]RAM35886.1 sensor histidine kinase [Arthrobacter globiformis]